MTQTKPRTRPRPPVPSPPAGAGKGVSKFRRTMSDEGKQRLSEIATQRHRDGDFRPRPGQSKRSHVSKRRLSQKIAERAAEEKMVDDVFGVFQAAMADTQPMSIRLKAAQALAELDLKDARQSHREDETESQKRDRDELLGLLSSKLTTGHTAILLRRQMEQEPESPEGVIEGQLVGEQDQLPPPEE